MKNILLLVVVLFALPAYAADTVVDSAHNTQTIDTQYRQDLVFMQRAIELSKDGLKNNNAGPVGAVIVKDGKIIGEGHNRMRIDKDPTAHGEIVAIRNAAQKAGDLKILQGATVYTTAQPCPMCYAACLYNGIKRIVYVLSCEETARIGRKYGFRDDEIYADIMKPEKERSIPQIQMPMLKEEALPALMDWARRAEKELQAKQIKKLQ
jgi:guanine deaminase